jgi:hypothetical protein
MLLALDVGNTNTVVGVFEGKELRVFAEEKDLPSDSLNARIDQTFVPRGQPRVPENAEQFQRWQAELVEHLHAKSFRDWPNHVPAAEVLKEEKDGRLFLATEPGIGVVARQASKPKEAKRLCLVVLNPDEPDEALPAWAKGLTKDEDEVLLLSPRGCGGLRPRPIPRSIASWPRRTPAPAPDVAAFDRVSRVHPRSCSHPAGRRRASASLCCNIGLDNDLCL